MDEATRLGSEFVGSGRLTKREHFAAMAMQGIIARCASAVDYPNETTEDAVRLADALLLALSANHARE